MINSDTLDPFLIKEPEIPDDPEGCFKFPGPPIYIGNNTVNLVINDYNSKKINNTDIIINMDGIDGKYGLLMQDLDHLGNWGFESTPSNYNYVKNNLYIGKYVISIMEEAGYKFTNSINTAFFEEQLNFHSNFSSEMKMYSCNKK
jgi:hypothetical protein